MRSVLITRPQPAAADLADQLKLAGMTAYISPLMEYEAIPADLSVIHSCQAIVFTSAQAAKIFAELTHERGLTVFAVGEATAHAASRAGFDRVHVSTGDSGNLAGMIRARAAKSEIKKIFHPAGEDTAADLSKMLADDGITIERVPIYKARFVESLSPDAIEALKRGKITTITLFSGRTAENFVNILKKTGLDGICPKLEAVCLSPRVAKEIKELNWRSVHVAKNPDIASMMNILSGSQDNSSAEIAAWLPAYPLIAAFGGVQPIARRLKISDSVVRSWQGRDIVPEKYNEMIIAAAEEDGIHIDHLWREKRKTAAQPAPVQQMPAQATPHFARGPDRRQTPTVFDDRGYVVSPNYVGPDRRSGLDRRDPNHAKLQQQRIRAEKWRFMSGTVLSVGIMVALVLYAGIFILAPEVVGMKNDADRLQETEAQLAAANARLAEWQKAHGQVPPQTTEAPKPSLGAMISHGIEKIEDAGASIGQSVTSAGTTVSNVTENASLVSGVQELSSLLTMVRQMNGTPEGQQKLDGIVGQLEALATKAPADRRVLSEMVEKEKDKNPDIKALLGHVNKNNLSAATLLLILNEMRGDMNNSENFESGLLILKKYFSDNPQMLQSLDMLTPYAKSGVLSRTALQTEFKGAAADIVMAKLKGEDASFGDKFLERLGKYVKMRRVDDIEGQEVDAVVARAQLLLEKNDVQGAMKELQSLEGGSAEAAAPWLQQAQGALIADQTSSTLIQGILSQVSMPGQGVADSVTSVFDEALGVLGGGGSNVIYLSPSMQPGSNGLGGVLGGGGSGGGNMGGVLGGASSTPDLSQFPLLPY
jgi:uroporphyrinogen-III synthase